MRWMRASILALASLAFLGLLLTFYVEAGFRGRVVRVQPLERDGKAESGWKFVGSPIEIVDPPVEKYVTKGQLGAAPQVDKEDLRDAIPYAPIQKTIEVARWGAMAALITTLIGGIALRRIAAHPPDDL